MLRRLEAFCRHLTCPNRRATGAAATAQPVRLHIRENLSLTEKGDPCRNQHPF